MLSEEQYYCKVFCVYIYNTKQSLFIGKKIMALGSEIESNETTPYMIYNNRVFHLAKY